MAEKKMWSISRCTQPGSSILLSALPVLGYRLHTGAAPIRAIGSSNLWPVKRAVTVVYRITKSYAAAV